MSKTSTKLWNPDADLELPLRTKKPTTWLVSSDLFHEDVPDTFIDQTFAVMALCPQHTFHLLTKRAERMREYAEKADRHNTLELAADAIFPGKGHLSFGGKHMLPTYPFANVWLGHSIEDQKRADERIPHLLQTPAAVRFLSVEPLLGPVDLGNHLTIPGVGKASYQGRYRLLDWVIVGGESGAGARPCQIGWIRDLVTQCGAAKVPVFVKQLGSVPWGEHNSNPAGSCLDGSCFELKLRHPKGGDPAEWPEDLRIRQYPATPAHSPS